MNNVLTLPPSVCGKVVGLLKFSVIEIQISKNNINLKNESDIITQVQWWGENLPISLRPGKVWLLYSSENYHSIHTCHQTAEYEIRTSLNLLKEYLKTCEVLEVVVIDINKNIIIGSAFLNNLPEFLGQNLIYKTSPIVDYQGDVIGAVKILLELCTKKRAYFIKEERNTHIISQKHLKVGDIQNEIKMGEKTIKNTMSNLKKNNESNSKASSDFFSNFETENMQAFSSNKLKNLKGISNFHYAPAMADEKNILTNQQTEQIFPQIETEKDFSKVIFYDLGQSKNNKRLNKNMKTLPTNTNNIKSTPKTQLHVSKTDFLKSQSKYFPKFLQQYKVRNNSKDEKLKSKQPISKIKKDFDSFSCNRSSNQNGPDEVICLNPVSKGNEIKISDKFQVSCKNTTVPKNVLDYLQGCEMNKEDEEKALSNLVEISPCQHFVKIINKLYKETPNLYSFLSQSELHKELKPEHFNNLKITYQNSDNFNYKNAIHLNFNFNDPVEKKYYEKFFGNDRSIHSFQLAQMLNHPESDLNRQNLPIYEIQSDLKCNDSLSFSTKGSDSASMVNVQNENFSEENNKTNKSVENCCNYYKKLNELDKIIESLNHYEEKILMQGSRPINDINIT